MSNTVILLLSGSGERFGVSLPKQFIKLKGSPLFCYSLKAFEKNKLIDDIILVVKPIYINEVEKYISNLEKPLSKKIKIIEGGVTRQMSSYLGTSSITDFDSKVLIHDAARPFIKQSIIDECLLKLDYFQAVSTVIPVSDTLYFTNGEDKIIDIPNRDNFVRAQTPQAFHLGTILSAHKLSQREGNLNAPDDCSLIKRYNLADIGLVAGDINNIKITYPKDIKIAETLLDQYYEN
jgi:2-C-methyl-D-erythritol 4-phosphate cytidylyltransferase